MKTYKEMRITITGPRSIGKTTISKQLAKKLKFEYISSDELTEKSLKKQGGLDKAIKSNTIEKFIKNESYNLIRKQYTKNNFIFDLAGGAVSSKKYSKVSKKVREIARKNSIVIGLLPSRNINESVNFLFEREKNRKHFKKTNKKELFNETKKDYRKFPKLFNEFCNFVIYTKDKPPEEIIKEITIKLYDKNIEEKIRKQFIIVKSLVTNDEGEVLFVIRKMEELKEAHNKWEFPGGKVDFGETPEETAVRESKEETGYDIKIDYLLPKILSSKWESKEREAQQILICYACSIVDGKVTLKDHGVSEIKWFKIEDAPKDSECLPGTIEFLNLYTKLLKLKKT